MGWFREENKTHRVTATRTRTGMGMEIKCTVVLIASCRYLHTLFPHTLRPEKDLLRDGKTMVLLLCANVKKSIQFHTFTDPLENNRIALNYTTLTLRHIFYDFKIIFVKQHQLGKCLNLKCAVLPTRFYCCDRWSLVFIHFKLFLYALPGVFFSILL